MFCKCKCCALFLLAIMLYHFSDVLYVVFPVFCGFAKCGVHENAAMVCVCTLL